MGWEGIWARNSALLKMLELCSSDGYNIMSNGLLTLFLFCSMAERFSSRLDIITYFCFQYTGNKLKAFSFYKNNGVFFVIMFFFSY